jgi:tetratricopeptide (TPR) repeat protein
LHAAGRTDEAIGHFRRALELKRDFVGAHFNLGIALEWQSKRDEAILEYRAVLRLQPDSTAAQARLRALGAPPTP